MIAVRWFAEPCLRGFNAASVTQLSRLIQLWYISILNHKQKLDETPSDRFPLNTSSTFFCNELTHHELNFANGLVFHHRATRWCRATILSAVFPLISQPTVLSARVCVITVLHGATQCLSPAMSIVFRYCRSNKTSTLHLHIVSTVTTNHPVEKNVVRLLCISL